LRAESFAGKSILRVKNKLWEFEINSLIIFDLDLKISLKIDQGELEHKKLSLSATYAVF